MPRLAIAFAVVVCWIGVAPARADTQGATGAIVGLQINSAHSDLQATYHGQVWVETGGQLQPYGWCGAVCSTFDLNQVEEQMLQRALDNPRILVQPFWKQGTNQTRCVVAFRLIRRDWQGLF